MYDLKFSSEERRKIKKAINLILDDIRELWKITPIEEINIHIDQLLKCYYCDLCINENEIYLQRGVSLKITLEEQKIEIKIKRINDYQICLDLVQNYEGIRKKILEIIEKYGNEKEDYFYKIDNLLNKYNNKGKKSKKISKSEENILDLDDTFQSISVINFGNDTINLVTNGVLVLKDKPDEKGFAKTK